MCCRLTVRVNQSLACCGRYCAFDDPVGVDGNIETAVPEKLVEIANKRPEHRNAGGWLGGSKGSPLRERSCPTKTAA
jgi:hypothetical protein